MNTVTKESKVLTIKDGKTLLASLPDATAGLQYYVVGAYCWGRDINAVKAAKHARSWGSKGSYTIHLMNDTAKVDSIDGTVWHNSKFPGVKPNIAHFKQS